MLVYDIASAENAVDFGIWLHISKDVIHVSSYSFKVDDPGVFNGYELSTTSPIIDKIITHKTQVITLEGLKSLPEWEDYTIWGIIVRDSARRIISGPVNRNAYTIASKFNRRGFLNLWGNILVELVVPHSNVESFDEIGISAIVSNNYPLITNIAPEPKDPVWFDDPETGMQSKIRHMVLPTIDILGPDVIDKDNEATYTVHLEQNKLPFHKPVTVHLDSTGGYLPLRRLDDMVYEYPITVKTDGLRSGQRFVIKAGFKYWTSLGEKGVTIR